MANIKSAKKAAKVNEKRRVRNLSRKTGIKTAIKKVMTALASGEPADQLMALFNEAQAKLSRAKSKRVLHTRTASRKISRLAKRVKAGSAK